ncbi:hypothetical protein ACLOJK_026923 [Asimina triloba]
MDDEKWKKGSEIDLEIENDGPLSAENGGGIGKKRVEDPKIASVDLDPVHDGILVEIEDGALAGAIEEDPAPQHGGLLLQSGGLRVGGDDVSVSSHLGLWMRISHREWEEGTWPWPWTGPGQSQVLTWKNEPAYFSFVFLRWLVGG